MSSGYYRAIILGTYCSHAYLHKTCIRLGPQHFIVVGGGAYGNPPFTEGLVAIHACCCRGTTLFSGLTKDQLLLHCGKTFEHTQPSNSILSGTHTEKEDINRGGGTHWEGW